MPQKTIAGKTMEVNEEGYLVNMDDWDKSIAEALAQEIGIGPLTEAHWKVIDYLRKAETEKVALSLRKVGKSGVVSIKELYQLFPGGPLKKASLIAGIRKPVSCV